MTLVITHPIPSNSKCSSKFPSGGIAADGRYLCEMLQIVLRIVRKSPSKSNDACDIAETPDSRLGLDAIPKDNFPNTLTLLVMTVDMSIYAITVQA